VILRISRFVAWLKQDRQPQPIKVDHRKSDSLAAVVFVHGFSGDTSKTWAGFVESIVSEPTIATWDVFGLGFPSSLRIDVPIWSADPDISLLARGLRTSLVLPPFDGYRQIAIAAHSMGGLIAQRAILDDKNLEARVSHLFLFGTPSLGLPSAARFAGLKRQIRDMASGSPFITDLRRDWTARFPERTPFSMRVVAGDLDVFVPPTTSLGPFPDAFRAVVHGNHLQIVKPNNPQHASVQLVVSALSGQAHFRGLVDGARVAIELGRDREAVDTLLPQADKLDDSALTSLAFALEALGRGQDALDVLERHFREGNPRSTDVIGALAGRVKRRWLTARSAADLARARELYLQALSQAELTSDHEQAYYHAINIAFLDLLASTPGISIPQSAREMATRALAHCDNSAASHWRSATEGEAWLILGDEERAHHAYRRAISLTQTARDLDSIYSQAIRIAARVKGDDGARRLEGLFGLQTRA
jgi:pimeloyl-ACP methyl ester carboxylesterase